MTSQSDHPVPDNNSGVNVTGLRNFFHALLFNCMLTTTHNPDESNMSFTFLPRSQFTKAQQAWRGDGLRGVYASQGHARAASAKSSSSTFSTLFMVHARQVVPLTIYMMMPPCFPPSAEDRPERVLTFQHMMMIVVIRHFSYICQVRNLPAPRST